MIKKEQIRMVKHVILWKLKEELTDTEKEEVKKGIKEGLEGLAGKIPGMVEVKVNINGLPTSTVDVMLDTTFTDADALKAYSTNPLHVAVADGKVRPYTAVRSCLDYEV
jgi:hypothetical protein